MKTLIYLIIIILVIWLGYNYFTKDSAPVAVDDKKDDTMTTATTSSEVVTGTYQISSNETKVEWTGSKTLIKDYYDSGSIMIKSGVLVVADNKINSGEIIFDMASIASTKTAIGSDEDKLTSHLKSDAFFDVAKYPEAKFKVTGMFYADTQLMLRGDLTMKATTSPISLPVIFAMEGGNVVLRGEASVDRTIWDVRYGSGKFFQGLGDKVINDIFTLKFKVVAKPQL